MIAYVNPSHGDDSTAVLNDRKRPWRTHAPALEALENARAQQSTAPGGIVECFRMVETHKPLEAADSADTA